MKDAGLIKQIVFHNLSNIRPLFKEVFDIEVTNEQEVLELIEKRHHIIHINGFDKNNNPVLIRAEDIETAIIYPDYNGFGGGIITHW